MSDRAIETHHIKRISYSQRQGKEYAVKQRCEDLVADCICFRDDHLAYFLERLEPLVEKFDVFNYQQLKGFSCDAEVLFLAKKMIASQPDVLVAWSKLRQEIQPLMK